MLVSDTKHINEINNKDNIKVKVNNNNNNDNKQEESKYID